MKRAYSIKIQTTKYAWALEQGHQAPQYFLPVIRIGMGRKMTIILTKQTK